jgi:NADH:ubiquinone oxidoreductase subunit 6 (subunit J)
MDAFRIILVVGAIAVVAVVVVMYLRDRRRRTAQLPARDDTQRL